MRLVLTRITQNRSASEIGSTVNMVNGEWGLLLKVGFIRDH